MLIENNLREYARQLHDIADRVTSECLLLKNESRKEGQQLRSKNDEIQNQLNDIFNNMSNEFWTKKVKTEFPWYLRWLKFNVYRRELRIHQIIIYFTINCTYKLSCSFSLYDF